MSTEQRPITTKERRPDWWHRDHPTFTALAGFYAGLAFALLVPGGLAAVLRSVFGYDTPESLFPFVFVPLAAPLLLLIPPRTRRFGGYLLLGMVTTLLVVGGVAVAVLWYMVNYRS